MCLSVLIRPIIFVEFLMSKNLNRMCKENNLVPAVALHLQLLALRDALCYI